MSGLILKDFINLKKNIKVFAFLIVIYGIMAYASEDASFFSTIFTVLFAVLTLSLYSYDEMAKWDSFALTMPITRDNIVLGKYMMMILLTAIGVATGVLFAVVMYFTKAVDTPFPAIISCMIGASVAILFYSIIIPIITKIGVEKARIILVAIYIVPFFIFIMANKAISAGTLSIPKSIDDVIGMAINYAYVIIPIALIVFIGISYTISINIYRKKEF